MISTLKLTSTNCKTGVVDIKEMNGGVLKIGRQGEDNDWILSDLDPDPRVSRQHCFIEYQNENYFITDTSNNGTFQNSKKLLKYTKTQLKNGDVLRLCENPTVYELKVTIQIPPAEPRPVNRKKNEADTEAPWWKNPAKGQKLDNYEREKTLDLISAKEVLQSFCNGANLKSLSIADDKIPALLFTLGQLFRLTIEGLNDLLQVRNDVKKSFNIASHTIIGGGKLNPIKGMAVEKAMEQLLTQKLPNCLPAYQALDEVLTDLRVHELAFTAGIQEALNRLIEQFDPHNLESQISERMLIENVLPDISKVRYWNEYVKFYTEIANDAKSNFKNLFGDEFAVAYDQIIEKLGDNLGDGV